MRKLDKDVDNLSICDVVIITVPKVRSSMQNMGLCKLQHFSFQFLFSILISFNSNRPFIVFSQSKGYRFGYVEKIDAEHKDVVCESANVPVWLNGFLLRQVCGAFGPMPGVEGERLTHFLDCMGMVVKFDFQGGSVKYSNKYYRTKAYRSWNEASKAMSKSKVSWNTLYSPLDSVAYRNVLDKTTEFVETNPNVDFWRHGSQLKAVSESITGYFFDPNSMSMSGKNFPYADTNFGLDVGTRVLGEPAHAAVDSDGVLWNTGLAFTLVEGGAFRASRIVYKVVPGMATRQVVGTLDLPQLHLANGCKRGTDNLVYYDDAAGLRGLGYIHSISVTANYVILPSSSYYFNPCYFLESQDTANAGAPQPFYRAWMKWEEREPATFYAVEKSTGQFSGTFRLETPLFITHQINAFEQDGARPRLVADMLVYKSARLYTEYLYVDKLRAQLDTWPMEASLTRFTMEIGQTSVAVTNLNKAALAAEYPNVNPRFQGLRSYTFVYVLMNPQFDDSYIVKLDVKNSAFELQWKPPNGVYPQDPVFIPTPDGTAEDAGLLLIPALDSNTRRGMVYIVDATNMALVGSVTAPDLVPFGLHTRFFTRAELGYTNASPTFSALHAYNFFAVTVIIIAVRHLWI